MLSSCYFHNPYIFIFFKINAKQQNVVSKKKEERKIKKYYL